MGIEITHAHTHPAHTHIHTKTASKAQRERIRVPQLPQVPGAGPRRGVEYARAARRAPIAVVGLRTEVPREAEPRVESELEQRDLVAAGGTAAGSVERGRRGRGCGGER